MTESQFQVWLLEHGYAVWLQKFMFAAVISRCVRDEMPQAVVQAFGCPVQAMGMEMDVGDLQEEYGTLDDLDNSGKFVDLCHAVRLAWDEAYGGSWDMHPHPDEQKCWAFFGNYVFTAPTAMGVSLRALCGTSDPSAWLEQARYYTPSKMSNIDAWLKPGSAETISVFVAQRSGQNLTRYEMLPQWSSSIEHPQAFVRRDAELAAREHKQGRSLLSNVSRHMPDIFRGAARAGSPALPKVQGLLRDLFMDPRRVTGDMLVVRLMVDSDQNCRVTREAAEYCLNPILRELPVAGTATLATTLAQHDVLARTWVLQDKDERALLSKKEESSGRRRKATLQLQERSEDKQDEVDALIELLQKLRNVAATDMAAFVRGDEPPEALQFLVNDPGLLNTLLRVATPSVWEIMPNSWEDMMVANWGHDHPLLTLQELAREKQRELGRGSDSDQEDASSQAVPHEHNTEDKATTDGEVSDEDRPLLASSKLEESLDKKGKKRAPNTRTLTDSPTKKPKAGAPLSPRKPSRVQVPAGDFMATRSSPVKQRVSSRGASKVPDPCRSSTHDQNVCMLLTCTANNCDREHACNNRMQREWATPRRAPWIAPDAHAQHHVRVCMLGLE